MGTYETWDTQGNLLASVPAPPSDAVEASIRAKAKAALAANTTYLGIASPTAGQTTAQVKLLTRQNQALIRLLLAELDADDA